MKLSVKEALTLLEAGATITFTSPGPKQTYKMIGTVIKVKFENEAWVPSSINRYQEGMFTDNIEYVVDWSDALQQSIQEVLQDT